ncbi:MAG: hypothetical protein KIH89_004320 [Candidatus Shapirobacteria bacterium]|nr:hypothetical protein [Candidatus Shapirobacteria bacterium]
MSIEFRPSHFRPDFLSPSLPYIRSLSLDYSIISQDTGDRIVDSQGNSLSKNYPMIERYSFVDDHCVANFLLGGSPEGWRALSFNYIDKDKPWFIDIGDTFNHILVIPGLNYKIIGVTSTFGYILDNQFRQNHYQGYNAFRWDQATDTYYGMVIGYDEEKIKFFDQG